MALVMGTMIGIAAFGNIAMAAEVEGGARIQPRAVAKFNASCNSTSASFSYTNNTNDKSFMEGTGTVYDILGNELTTLYDSGYCARNKGISASYKCAGIYRFVVYAHMYDGPNAGYPVIDRQYQDCYRND